MCKAIQELQQEAVEEAVGIAVTETVKKEREKQQEAVAESTLRAVKSLMETLHLPAEQVFKAMKLSENEQAILKPMLQTQ